MLITFLLKLGALAELSALDKNNYLKNPYNTTDGFVRRMRKPFFDPELYDRINKIGMPKPPDAPCCL